MGIITLGLVISGDAKNFCSSILGNLDLRTAIAIGTSVGGWQLIRTLGSKFYKIRPVHGFASQTHLGGGHPHGFTVRWTVSTTQVVSTAIMGVGAAERMSKVRWGVAGEIASPGCSPFHQQDFWQPEFTG